jgi:heme a synthase
VLGSNKLSRFQKVALAALIAVVVLIFIGAVVRATGAGMGCPDWPKCWGEYIPPTHASEIDVNKLPIEKYKAKRERMGGNPDDITVDTVLAEFNPTHTWTEFTNRLCSLPVGLFSVLTMIMAFQFRSSRPWIFFGAFAAVFLVGLNAWMGARIVFSGLQPGTITTHMALAILLMCVQVYIVWGGGERRWLLEVSEGKKSLLKWVGLSLFLLIIIEGMMGSQVREMTDLLKKSHGDAPRSEWIYELEHTWVYIIHRSFSWVILGVSFWWFMLGKSYRIGGVKWPEILVLSMVLSQMVLGIILSNVGILRVVQVLHIGLSSLLVCGMFVWLLTAFGKQLGEQNEAS